MSHKYFSIHCIKSGIFRSNFADIVGEKLKRTNQNFKKIPFSESRFLRRRNPIFNTLTTNNLSLQRIFVNCFDFFVYYAIPFITLIVEYWNHQHYWTMNMKNLSHFDSLLPSSMFSNFHLFESYILWDTKETWAFCQFQHCNRFSFGLLNMNWYSFLYLLYASVKSLKPFSISEYFQCMGWVKWPSHFSYSFLCDDLTDCNTTAINFYCTCMRAAPSPPSG